jgi:hypothetical protein
VSAKTTAISEKTDSPEELGGRGASGLLAAELQQLWFACLRRPWSSLVVLPAHPEGSAQLVAQALAEIGGLHRNRPVKLINTEGLKLSMSSRAILEMTSHAMSGELTIVCADSVLSNQAGIPLALAADAVLLCVDLGQTDLISARRTIELVGANRFVGSVAIHPWRGPPR